MPDPSEDLIVAALQGDVDDLTEQYENLREQLDTVTAKLTNRKRALALMTGELPTPGRPATFKPHGSSRRTGNPRNPTGHGPTPPSAETQELVLRVLRKLGPVTRDKVATDASLSHLTWNTVRTTLSYLHSTGRVHWDGKAGRSHLWAVT